jgi:hypothetical protein
MSRIKISKIGQGYVVDHDGSDFKLGHSGEWIAKNKPELNAMLRTFGVPAAKIDTAMLELEQTESPVEFPFIPINNL